MCSASTSAVHHKREVIAYAPLRITLGGGGTDLRSYSEKFGGFLVAGAINKFSRVVIREGSRPGIHLTYPRSSANGHAANVTEHAASVQEIKHEIIRTVLEACPLAGPNLEILSACDLQVGKGLGSSGSFTVALLKALHAFAGRNISPPALAALACDIAINGHLSPGRQDQYIAALGGITEFTFHANGRVVSRHCDISPARQRLLEKNLMLFDTDLARNADQILQRQVKRIEHGNVTTLHSLDETKALGHLAHRALTGSNGSFCEFAGFMSRQWALKKVSNPSATTAEIDRWYEVGMASGALGGKLIGAGGGGYLMFYTEKHDALRVAMAEIGLRELTFAFEKRGCHAEVRRSGGW